MKQFILLLFFALSLQAKVYQKIDFKGDGIDFLVGDFAKDTLLKVIGKEYPPFYTPWRKDPTFSDREIEEYKSRLKKYFESLGYYKSDIKITPKEDALLVRISKGPRIKVATLKVHPDSKYKKLVRFRVGSPFRTDAFTQSKKGIERYLLEHAHPKYGFKAKALVDLAAYRVDLDFLVDENGSYNFGKTQIEGRGDVKEEIIRQAFRYREGEPYDIRKIEESYDKIYDLGVYDFITFTPLLDSNATSKGEIPINLKLKMGETKFLKGTVGYSTNEGARGSFEWIDKNFLGNLKVFDIGFKATQIGYEAFNIFYNPYIPVPYLGIITFENDIRYRHYRYDTFVESTLQNRLTFGKRYREWEHYFGLLTEYSKITAKVDTPENESGNYFLNSLFYRLLLDKRDSKVDAQNGYYIALYLEKSMKGIGSDLDYLKSTIDARYIKQFSQRWVGAVKLRLGRIDADVPIFKRFFTGGANTNRGYEYRDLGPKDSKGVPLGGVSLVDAMAEVRYRAWRKLWVTGFCDTSLLSPHSDNFRSTYYPSVGVGVRYKTVIGPIRVDFGFPQRKSGWTFHVSIGQVF